MRINRAKLDIALARACMNSRQLRESVSPQTIARAREGKDINTATVGRIARALCVDVAEIIETETEAST